MCPAPGQAWVYISDMSLDYPEEVMSKTSELFEKHGCLRFGMLSSKTGVNNSTT
jgi:hypothetical protein